MRRTVTVHQVDVFTETPFSGNPAAVVLDAEGLTDATMRAIALEMNLSETAFVFAEEPDGVVPVRFFTPSQEVPVCGHATLAAHYVRSASLGSTDGCVVQRSPGASWRVCWRTEAERTFVSMHQGPVERGPEWDGASRRRLLEALRIGDDALRPGGSVCTISTGHAKVVIPVVSAAVLARIEPDMEALVALSEASGVGGYFLFALIEGGGEVLTECRMFGPAIGVPEDPVNGSGHGPLGAYLAWRGGRAAKAAAEGFWSRMGSGMNRPGRVRVQVLEDGSAVDVGGFVASVFSAEIAFDMGEGR